MAKLFCGNLSYGTTDEDLSAFFADLGFPPTKVTILYDRETGRSRGFGFVEIASEWAEQAIDSANGTQFMERQLNVNIARPMEQRSQGRERKEQRQREHDGNRR